MSDLSNYVLEVLVVEDDFSFGLELQILLEKLGYKCGGIADTAENALISIRKKEPDAILMDIELKGKVSGLDLADKIKDRNIPILFITSFNDDARYARAKEFNYAGFLVKPLDSLTLLSALDACLGTIKEKVETKNVSLFKQELLIKKNKLFHKINLNDILLISSDREYATIHTHSGKFIIRESLKLLADILPKHNFIKCHQSNIINIDHLVSIDTDDSIAILTGQLHVPFSRRNKKRIFDKFQTLK